MTVTMTFNGESRSYLRVLSGLKRSAWAPVTRELLAMPGVPGAYLTGTRVEVREITVPIMISGTDSANLQALKEDMAIWLVHDGPKPLVFSDESNRTYFAVVEQSFDPDEIIRHGEGEIKFICLDPYKYGDLKTSTITSGGVVANRGSVESKPVFDLEVTQNIPFAMVQNGVDDYMMIGAPTNVEQSAVNTRNLLKNETGSTLSTWVNAPTNLGGNEGGMSFDGTGIVPSGYGTGAGYHGPVRYFQLPAEVGDFEVELYAQLNSDVAQVGRLGFACYDSRPERLCSFLFEDTSPSVQQKSAIGRVGPYDGSYSNAPVTPKHFSVNMFDFKGYLRIRRVGNNYEFYAARIDASGTHRNATMQSWTTPGSNSMGRLKYVTIFHEGYGTNATPALSRITNVKAWELTGTSESQAPNIAYVGDVITFDHAERRILINGADRTDLKDFGARYFSLAPGNNIISVFPLGAFNTNIRYRERYR